MDNLYFTDDYDDEFSFLISEIEKRAKALNKYDKIRIKRWCVKLKEIDINDQWKKNRNLHAICLLDNLLNSQFEEPYSKFPPERELSTLNKTNVKAKLSKKFIENVQEIYRTKRSKKEKQLDEVNIEFDEKEIMKQKLDSAEKDNNKKDEEIKKLKEDKEKLIKRVVKLENMLAMFMSYENNTKEII